MNSGLNTIRLTADAGTAGPNIDYLRLDPEVVSISNAPEPELVNSMSFTQIVYNTLTTNPPIANAQIAVKNNDIWVVNSDANTVINISRSTLQKTTEVGVGENPVSISYVCNNEI